MKKQRKKLYFQHKGDLLPLPNDYDMPSMLQFFKEIDRMPKFVIKKKNKKMII